MSKQNRIHTDGKWDPINAISGLMIIGVILLFLFVLGEAYGAGVANQRLGEVIKMGTIKTFTIDICVPKGKVRARIKFDKLDEAGQVDGITLIQTSYMPSKTPTPEEITLFQMMIHNPSNPPTPNEITLIQEIQKMRDKLKILEKHSQTRRLEQ